MFRSSVYIVLCLASAFYGSLFILLPVLPYIFINPIKFRYSFDHIIGFWLSFPVALLEYFFGLKVLVSGDKIDSSERSLILLNHRTRLDWMFFWPALCHQDIRLLTTEKIILKAQLKHVPGAGWAMGCNSFIFLERFWERDKLILTDVIEFYSTSKNNYQLMIFPEGTDYSEKTKQRSIEYSRKNNLPEFEYVLQPRSTGFTFLVDRMRERSYFDSIYDVTIGYPDYLVQSEKDFALGGCPKAICFHIQRYDAADIPSDKHQLEQWLRTLWLRKDALLRSFYASRTRRFVNADEYMYSSQQRFALWFSLIFWLSNTLWWTYWTYHMWQLKVYLLLGVCVFVGLTAYWNGIERWEILMHKKHKKS